MAFDGSHWGRPLCEAGLDLLRHFEGLGDGDTVQPGLQPYQDMVGVWTVGYGATRYEGRPVSRAWPETLTPEEAEALLQGDVARYARAVDRLVVVPVTESQRAALTSFAYNLGSGALKASTLLRRVNGGDWEDVPNQFLRWVYAGGRRVAGLERRRAAEAMLWMDY